MGDPLTGHVILIADPRAQRFVRDLQGALEQRGAETLIAQEPADAIDRAREFRFSVAVINCDDASDALRKLIHDLGLLYGSEAASAASKTVGPHLALARSNVESITGALGGLLGADRH